MNRRHFQTALVMLMLAGMPGCRTHQAKAQNMPEASKTPESGATVKVLEPSEDKELSSTSIAKQKASTTVEQADQTQVKWLTFEEAVEKSKREKRKIFVDVFTDWCGWCKVMDNKTFPDPEIARLLNEKFYPVKLNAEQRADVVFNGVTFKFVESGRNGYHQLAAALLNNQMSYPNFVFLNEDFHIIPLIQGYSSLPGYRKPEEFHIFLTYVGNDHYKNVKLSDYEKVYQSPYPAGK
jgi:thioredoxin-related protein